MCLTLTKDSSRLRKNLRRRKKPIIVYKILRDNLRSPYCDYFRWKIGLNQSSRANTNITYNEQIDKIVYKGFHFYVNLQDAKEMCLFVNGGMVYKASISPKDIIAVGEFNTILRRGVPSVVATKATLLERVQ